MSDAAFMVATAAVVVVGVALRRLLPQDGSAAALEAQADQATG